MTDAAAGRPYGLVAEFADADRLLGSIARVRDAGYRRIEACTPFPVEGMTEALGFRDRRIPWLTLLGGVLGAVLGFGMQVYTNLAYPIDIGGRPLVAIPAFMLITFELMVLGAVVLAIGGMLVLNRLPRLHHPLFDLVSFDIAGPDRFFLVIFGDDDLFDGSGTKAFLETLQPVRVDCVHETRHRA